MDSCVCSMRHCFIEQDNDLTSIAVMESGYSRSDYKTHNQNGLLIPLGTSLRDLSCYGKSIGGNKDVFMYRGDTPFCSEECRQEQIEIDEAKERNQSLSSSMKANKEGSKEQGQGERKNKSK